MAGQILVPFNSRLRINDLLSVVEQAAAKPGMSVVFLIRYPIDPWAWLRDHWITTESSRNAMLAGRRVVDRYSWEEQRALAEQWVAPWRYALQKSGAKVAVDVYTGSWSNVMEKYSDENEIPLPISEENDRPIMEFLRRSIASFRMFKRASFRPILSLRSHH
ncbi:MAG TPA: hypothetical protein VEG60_24260 [Candidatus Binatia bacterium]|nr:hypothetical protein [Candidatus Binatia bacterium]